MSKATSESEGWGVDQRAAARRGRSPEVTRPRSPDKESHTELRILIIEDDEFQQSFLQNLISAAISKLRERDQTCVPTITITPTASGALEACKANAKSEQGSLFQLVLLDYLLPAGFHGNELLPALRASLGLDPAVVMLSAAQMEPSLKLCLNSGADSYRLKPLSIDAVVDILTYTLSKERYLLQKRSRSPTPDPGGAPSIHFMQAMHTVLASGRRTNCYLAERAGEVVIAKEMPVCGKPPPPHPYLNKVLDRIRDTGGATFIEIRELCDGGELFDFMFDHEYGLPPQLALRWIVQLVDAVAHAHQHGAVHGQLRPENVLLLKDRVQLVGFYTVLAMPVTAALAAADDVDVELRKYLPNDAPELKGKTSAYASSLAACDVYALGHLLDYLLTGDIPSASAAAVMPTKQPAGVPSPQTDVVDAVNLISLVGRDRPSGAGGRSPGSHSQGSSSVDIGDGDASGHGSSSASSKSASLKDSPAMQPANVKLDPRPRQAANRYDIVRAALTKLSTAMLSREPQKRPTAADLLADLGNIQLVLP